MFINSATIIFGLAAIAFGCFAKTFFWAKGFHGSLSDKRAPTWLGRTLFIFIGAVFLIFGFYHLFHD